MGIGKRSSQNRLRHLLRHGHKIGGNTTLKTLKNAKSKTLNGKTLVGKITDGMIILAKIESACQCVIMRFVFEVVAYREWRFLVSDGECTQNTSLHAHFSVLTVCVVF